MISEHITEDMEISSDSDREDFYKENSNEESFDEKSFDEENKYRMWIKKLMLSHSKQFIKHSNKKLIK